MISRTQLPGVEDEDLRTNHMRPPSKPPFTTSLQREFMFIDTAGHSGAGEYVRGCSFHAGTPVDGTVVIKWLKTAPSYEECDEDTLLNHRNPCSPPSVPLGGCDTPKHQLLCHGGTLYSKVAHSSEARSLNLHERPSQGGPSRRPSPGATYRRKAYCVHPRHFPSPG